MFIQVISIAGALLVLGAYGALQTRRVAADNVSYQVMNLFGGFFLFLAAMTSKQIGLIAIEAAWTIMSAAGLWKAMRSQPRT